MDKKTGAALLQSHRVTGKGISAIKKLADAASSTKLIIPEAVAKEWLFKQAHWQIYLPAPRYVPRPKV